MDTPKKSRRTRPRRPKTTLKQTKFISEYIKSGNATEAALKAYNCSNNAVAGAIGAENLQKPNIMSKIATICQRRGLNEDWAVKIIKKAGKAKKIVSFNGKDQQVDDHPTQLNAADRVLKLHGHLQTGVNITEDNRQVNIGVQSAEDIQALSDLADKYAQIINKAKRSTDGQPQQSGEIVDVENYRVD